ncbi:MAG: gluconate:H+ symporter [Pseudomonadota bacterium]
MELIAEHRAVLATLAAVAALLVLIIRVRMNAFIALMLIAILSALAAGMAPDVAFETLTRGMGGTLGFIAPVIGLGAVFGAILQASGGVEALARGVGNAGSPLRQSWIMGGLGLVAATPVFFDVALLILIPFVLGLAHKTGRSPLLFGLPLSAGLAAGHAFVPPTPGPIAIAELIGADLGWVIVFGAVVGLVSVAIAGPIYAAVLERSGTLPSGALAAPSDEKQPLVPRVSLPVALGLISLPLILILSGTVAGALLESGALRYALTVIGHPFSALLIASGATWWALRPDTEENKRVFNEALTRAFEPTGAVILVTGAGGAFKQVLVDTGAGADVANAVLGLGLTPVLAGFVLALVVRVAQGSATVAMITAAGLAAPIVAMADLSAPQLGILTISIAAGATGFSHVNDSGFWLINRLFGLTPGETLRTWTVSTGIIALVGLAICCALFPFF